MNPLIYLAVVGSASAGIVVWQQDSIDRVRQNVDRYSHELVVARKGIEADRGLLLASHNRLSQVQGELQSASQEQDAVAAAQASLRTPDREGWWPKDHPYFYLSKRYLAQVEFRSCQLPIAEVNALMTKREAALNKHITYVSVCADKGGNGTFDYQLFEAGKLNRDMAALLGMTGEQTERTDELYAQLDRAIKEIEAARVERVDPPQPDASGIADHLVVARMPDLSEEVNPLQASLRGELKQMLGDDRAGVLVKQAEDYFANHSDKLGTVPREFVQQGKRLNIYRYEKWGRQWSTSNFGHQSIHDAQYSHLFGPGAPCELK